MSVNPRNSLEETQKLIDDLKESLSDFGSCVSEVSDNDDRNVVVSSVSDQRENNGSSKKKKKKRKGKFTPEKSENLPKKTNLELQSEPDDK